MLGVNAVKCCLSHHSCVNKNNSRYECQILQNYILIVETCVQVRKELTIKE